jgi:hypothetical protein
MNIYIFIGIFFMGFGILGESLVFLTTGINSLDALGSNLYSAMMFMMGFLSIEHRVTQEKIDKLKILIERSRE